MKLVYSALLVLIVNAILNSYLAVSHQPKPLDNYWADVAQRLEALKRRLPTLAQIDLRDGTAARDLALTYRQNGNEEQAESIFKQLWKLDAAKKSLVYDPEYIFDARELAQMYEERAAFDTAFYYRKLILEYDRQCWPANDLPIAHDNRIARDLTNYAITLHIAGMASPDAVQRTKYLELAEKTYQDAYEVYEHFPGLDANRAYNLRDQALVLRDLGRTHESVQLTIQADSLLKSFKS